MTGLAPRPWYGMQLAVAALILAAMGCAGGDGATSDSADAARDIRITLERGACFGRCPMYEVALDGSGKVVFEGRNFVKELGRHEDNVPVADVRALATEMEQAGYFAFEEQYPPDATDHATVVSSLTLNGRTRRIEHNLGSRSAPDALETLYARIDEVARSAKWIGEPQTGPPLKGRSSEPPIPDTGRDTARARAGTDAAR